MESGNRAVSTLELVKLAKLFHCDVSDLVSEEGNTADAPLVLHRLDMELQGSPEVQRRVQHCLEICREGIELESILKRPERSGPPAYRLPTPRNAGEAVIQGATIASQERQRLALGDAPIPDIADLINCQGIWATAVNLPDAMSGLFLYHRSIGMVTLVNQDHNAQRKRFSYAHEYAHAILDRERTHSVSTKENSVNFTEKRANAFAAAFLMPEAGIRKSLESLHKGRPSRVEQFVFDVANDGWVDTQFRPEPGSQDLAYQDLAQIAHWFDVSYQACVYRLRSLNIVSQKECDELLKKEEAANKFRSILQIMDSSQDKEEAHSADHELLAQVMGLAIEARRRQEISRGRILELAEVLGVTGSELLELADAASAD
jgi:Zn-dependent peptidase ImmA (M78 family)